MSQATIHATIAAVIHKTTVISTGCYCCLCYHG